MHFYDSLIEEVNTLTAPLITSAFSADKGKAWRDAGCNQVVLQRESVCELSGTGFNLVTSSAVEDGIFIAGDGLDKIKGEHKFARVCIIQIDDEQDEQKAYNLIRKIEYVKYHCFPDGYMIRTSSNAQREAVRVAGKAVDSGMDFNAVGNLLIEKYKEIPSVRGVKIIFITVPQADFDSLSRIAEKGDAITKTLNHIVNTVNFDCDTCNLKAICDEVEGMRELHFGSNSRNGM